MKNCKYTNLSYLEVSKSVKSGNVENGINKLVTS